MGMYDTLHVVCPHCHTMTAVQSKGGDCLLKNYSIDNCPAKILTDIAGTGALYCDECSRKYRIRVMVFAVAETWVEMPDTTEER